METISAGLIGLLLGWFLGKSETISLYVEMYRQGYKSGFIEAAYQIDNIIKLKGESE